MGYMRLSDIERKALKTALTDFDGEVYLFGSRLDPKKRGGDIDILLKPAKRTDRYALKDQITATFTRQLEQSLDVVVYNDKSEFCQEIIRYAQLFNPAQL